MATRVLCKGHKHLSTFMNNITKWKGEGTILRKCGSQYESGRAASLIKLKVKYDFLIFILPHLHFTGNAWR